MSSVAILLCTFNGARFLPAQLSSLADQTFTNWRLLVSDDGSTDQTLARLRRAEPDFPSLKVIHFPRNGGAGTVRRIGSQQARGDIVVWTDADLTYPNERIPELAAILSHPGALSSVVKGVEKTGRRAVLLAENKDELPGTPKQVVNLLTTQEAHNLTAPPTRTWLIHYTVWMSTPSPALAA